MKQLGSYYYEMIFVRIVNSKEKKCQVNTLNCRLIFFFFNFRNKVSQKNISSLCYKSVNLILDALSSEFHSTSSTSESPPKKEQWEKSEQKTKIMETVKLEGEK